MRDYCDYLNPALELAIAAGREILRFYDSGYAVEVKADHTPVTEADVAAHHLIVAGLKALDATIPILSEEADESVTVAVRQQWPRFWLVDPLDGTREFIQHTGEFTVNIALVEAGRPLLGIVYAPVLGCYYYACRGHGAYKREGTGEPQRIFVRDCDPHHVVVACGHSSCSLQLQQLFDNLPGYEVISLGSALKSCLVAEGGADLYARFGPTSEWDTAAAQCIVEEAGGQITNMKMQPLRYNLNPTLLNPHFLVSGRSPFHWPDLF
ncbi:MAG: 3'(2'),5'-bisphosphate nucleotidase CysQ [Gammaproteobacteria bacterium]|nr:3'(2'),5'-bisphosphate nucleotidase CysQ [Gammaproteobacteria bacterium]